MKTRLINYYYDNVHTPVPEDYVPTGPRIERVLVEVDADAETIARWTTAIENFEQAQAEMFAAIGTPPTDVNAS